jgi:hypothetical protein
VWPQDRRSMEVADWRRPGADVCRRDRVDLRDADAPTYRIHYTSTVRATGETEEVDILNDLLCSEPLYGGTAYWFRCPSAGGVGACFTLPRAQFASPAGGVIDCGTPPSESGNRTGYSGERANGGAAPAARTTANRGKSRSGCDGTRFRGSYWKDGRRRSKVIGCS